MADNRIDDTFADDEFAGVVAAIQALEPGDFDLDAPPADVWDGIAASLADELDAAPRDGRETPHVTAVTSTPPLRSLSERRERLERQQRGSAFPARQMLLAAAAVVVVVVAVSAFVLVRTGGADTIATADLAYEPEVYDQLGENAVASVRLVDDEGAVRIEFDEAALPASELADEDLELWLLQIDESGAVVDLVSLGIVDDIDRRYAVPEGYDTDEYSVVDISVEPRDGDAQHSGRTILRGPLSA